MLADEEGPSKEKGPKLSVAIGIGKPKGDDALPPVAEDEGSEDIAAEPEGLFGGAPDEETEEEMTELPAEALAEEKDPMLEKMEPMVRQMVSDMLDERLGPQ
jgi:hypothetical protein